jgi:hypothetical protein
MLLVDLTEEDRQRERPLANDQRGYGVVMAGPMAGGQVYRLRVTWSAANPLVRQWVQEIRLLDGRWYAGPKVTHLGPAGSA